MSQAEGLAKTYSFKVETYNGIAIVRETTTGYINASRMCSDNGKKWRSYKQTNQWKDIEKVAEKYIKIDGVSGPSKIGRTQFDVINAENDYKGTYLHPKLIHFVAEYVSVDYAFQVQELMDSINEQVHHQLEEQQLEDKPENSHKLFLSTCETIIDLNMSNHANKQAQESFETIFSYGVRDLPKTNTKSFYEYNDALNKLIANQYLLRENSDTVAIYHVINSSTVAEIKKLIKNKHQTAKRTNRLLFLLNSYYTSELELVKSKFKNETEPNADEYNHSLIDELNNRFMTEFKFNPDKHELSNS